MEILLRVLKGMPSSFFVKVGMKNKKCAIHYLREEPVFAERLGTQVEGFEELMKSIGNELAKVYSERKVHLSEPEKKVRKSKKKVLSRKELERILAEEAIEGMSDIEEDEGEGEDDEEQDDENENENDDGKNEMSERDLEIEMELMKEELERRRERNLGKEEKKGE